MLNNYLEKRAAGGWKKLFDQGWDAAKRGFKANPVVMTTATVGTPLIIGGAGAALGNLAAGDSAETLAALDKAKQDLANEQAKGIADHASDNIGVYALAGTGLLGLGALGAYLASKSDKDE